MSTTISGRRNGALDGLRGLACLNVLLAHFLFPFFPYLARFQGATPPPIAPSYSFESYASWPLFTVLFNGTSAVCFFFVLSGYVLSRRFVLTGDRSQLLRGALKRYPRLMVPILASVLFAFGLQRLGAMHLDPDPRLGLAGWVLGFFGQRVGWAEAVYDGVVGAPLFGDGDAIKLNGVLWTVRIELVGSLTLFGCYFVLGRTLAAPIAAALLGLFSVTPTFFMAFSVGAGLCHLEPHLRQGSARLGPCLLALGVFCLGFDHSPVYTWLPFHDVGVVRVFEAAWVVNAATVVNILGSALVITAVLCHAGIARACGAPVLAGFGIISFGVYLLHWPLFCSVSTRLAHALIEAGVPRVAAIVATLVVSLGVVTIAAALLHRFIDDPNRRLLDRLERSSGIRRAAEAASLRLGVRADLERPA